MSFKVLHRTEIDEAAYMRCLAFTESRGEATTLYAQPWYLDIVANSHWSVAVWQSSNKDYELVLPFAHQRKWGLMAEVYMPFLCQQLGVFGKESQSISQFLKSLFSYWQSKFLRIDYSFNTDSLSPVSGFLAFKFSVIERVNQVVDCAKADTFIWKGISETKQKHIRRGERMVQRVENSTVSNAINAFLTSHTGERLSFNSNQKAIVFALASAFTATNSAVWYHLEHQETKTELLGLLQVRFGNRIISLFGGPTNSAKDNYAQDYALWQSIKHLAGLPNAVLDFEGSNIKGVQQYNGSFGATIKHYQHISWKRW